MQDSNRDKRRLLGFLASRGGRISSGRNDSLLRWVFELFARETYKHERIVYLEQLFVALEADGDVVLERDERGKLFAVRLADTANLDHADIDPDSFESNEEWWSLLTTLMAQNARLQRERAESGVEVVLELAAEAEFARDEAMRRLVEAEVEITAYLLERELSESAGDQATELARLSTLLDIATTKAVTIEGALREEREHRADERRRNHKRLSEDGNKIATLERTLEDDNHLIRQLNDNLAILALSTALEREHLEGENSRLIQLCLVKGVPMEAILA